MNGSGGGATPSGRTFETHRIAVLQGERERVQKKTFTKWCNSHLAKVSLRITDLYEDLRDGRLLLKLLEVLSGDKWAKPSRGTMRFHMLENNEKVFSYLRHAKIKVENMGPEDIVDGNQRLILGLIWTIILRFQIQDITFETEDDEKKSAKEALLLWTQRRTKGYKNVNIRNFTTSWKDGLAFVSLIHKHRPDLVNFNELDRDEPKKNLTLAFDVAEKQLGIPRLLDVEDVDVDVPDEKSIMTYVANYYHTFAKMKTGDVGSKRIIKIISFLQECENMEEEYNRLASSLLEWIEQTIETLANRDFPNIISGVQGLLAEFAKYRLEEKPPKYAEKGNLEVLFYNLNAKLRSQSQPGFVPEDGKLLSDIAKRWSELEAAEHAREVALREELMRLERLERMAEKFDKKAGMRATWLMENHKLVSQDSFGVGVAALEAAKKKHEAIQTDIKAYENRVKTVVDMAHDLENEKYWAIDRIKEDLDKVLELWEILLHALVSRREKLEVAYNYAKAMQDVNDLIEYLKDMKLQLMSKDYGKHLGDVDILLQKHSLLEAEYAGCSHRIKAALDVPQELLDLKPDSDLPSLCDQCEVLRNLVEDVEDLLKTRREKLSASQHLHKFYEDVDNEEEWIGEKIKIVSAAPYGSDLPTATSLQKHHDLFKKEVDSHNDIVTQVCENGNQLIEMGTFDNANIANRMSQVEEHYDKLVQLCKQRQDRLLEVVTYQTYLNDTEEIMLWLGDMEKLVKNEDLGSDEASSQLLLKKHKALEEEITGYEPMITGLKKQQDNLSSQDRLLPVTRERQDTIEKKYAEIQKEGKQRRQLLVFAYSMFLLYRESSGVLAWIKEKEDLLESIKAPEEYADADVVERRFESFLPELDTYEFRIEEVTDLGNQLIEKNHPKSDEIEGIIKDINEQWEKLNDLVEDKRIELLSIISLQQFKNSIQYCVNWINCKAKALMVIQAGDISNLDTKIRTVDLIEKELHLLQDKVEQLDKEVDKHERLTPEEREEITANVEEVSKQWAELNNLLEEKKKQLELTTELKAYLGDLDTMLIWLKDTLEEVSSKELDVGIARVDLKIKEHNERRAEIDSFKPKHDDLVEKGKKLSHLHPNYEVINDKVNMLEKDWEKMEECWDTRAKLLNQCRALQLFKRDVKLTENTLDKQDIVLEEMKASDLPPETRIKKLQTFEKLSALADSKLQTLSVTADALIDDDHYASDEIRATMETLKNRHLEQEESAKSAEDAINDAKRLQQFKDDANELLLWLKERSDALSEESLRDPSTYPVLLKQHEALRADLAENEPQLDKLKAEGQDIKRDNEEDPLIDSTLEEVQTAWDALEKLLEERDNELKNAEKSEAAKQKIQDIDVLVTDLGNALNSPDAGNDATSAKHMAKKYEILADEIDGLEVICEDIPEVEAEAVNPVRAERDTIKSRFKALTEPLEKKKKKLDEKDNLREFNRMAGDEEQYLKEKQMSLDNKNLGSTLMEAEMLLAKHKVFVEDITLHEPTYQAVVEFGRQLIAADHYGSNIIEARLTHLAEQWNDIQERMAARDKDLEENNLTQKFYFECTEAESYLKEIAHLITTDIPSDEASAETMLTKHKTVQASIDDHKDKISNLKEMLDSLEEQNHPLMSSFNNRYTYINDTYHYLEDNAVKRRKVLDDSYNLFHFNREISELNVYISSKEVTVNSTDLGRDYEHVQVLESKFNEFYTELTTIGQSRVAELCVSGQSLLDNNHSMSPEIKSAMSSVQNKWTNLLEMAAKRKETLASSVELHRYHRDISVLLSRIQTADVSIPSDLGRDVNTVQALQRKHQSMSHDVQALQSQVDNLKAENVRLQEQYPGARAKGVSDQLEVLESLWEKLQNDLSLRKDALSLASELFTFLRSANQLIQWGTNMRKLFVSDELGSNVSAVELQIAQHNDLRCEMDTRQSNKDDCEFLGKSIIEKEEFVDIVQFKLDELNQVWDKLYKDWDNANEELDIILEAHTFARDAGAAKIWINNQNSNLTDPPETTTLDHIEALLRKFENFERAINAQSDRFNAFNNRTRYEDREGEGRRMAERTAIEVEEADRAKSDNQLAIEVARQLQGKASQWKRKSEIVREAPSWLLAVEEENLQSQPIENGHVSPDDEVAPKEAVQSKPNLPDSAPPPDNESDDATKISNTNLSKDVSAPKPDIVVSTPVKPPKPLKKELDIDSVVADGKLMRKIVSRRTGDSKSLDKNWTPSHICIRKGNLFVYKDEKNLKEGSPLFEEPILNCTVDIDTEHKKKKNVFKFSSIIGTTYLFQATSEDEMNNWISKIKQVRDMEDREIVREHSPSHDKSTDHLIPDNAADVTISDKLSEAGSTDPKSPEKKKSKGLKKKKPSLFRKRKE